MRDGKLIRFDEKLLTEIKIEALRQGVSYRKLMAAVIKSYLDTIKGKSEKTNRESLDQDVI